ncbi:MAG: hypothetical protein KAS32_14935 [Candidatus Peribacteraceae bacterium]|nr:hypothetical protein [Candidatus Peribacteraceae bacterium]
MKLQSITQFITNFFKCIFVYPFTACMIGPLRARHYLFHDDYEVWSLIEFTDGDDLHWFSDHQVTCIKCKLVTKASRAWIKKGKFGSLNVGTTRKEALKQAKLCDRNT